MTKSVYCALLTLYPWDYRAVFSEDMRITFDEGCEVHRVRGRWQFLCFAAAEISSLASGVAKEWLAKLTTEESVRGRSLPDLRKMRPVGIAYEVWFASLDRPDRVKSATD